MEQEAKKTGQLREIYERLGKRNQSVNDTLKLLKSRGVKASRASIYQTIDGRSNRREVVEAFMEVAEAELARRRQLEKRATRIIADS
ncbi:MULTISPECIES: hypothetical protein [Hymenobacter]|uniref:Uncharacterized protein n=1 Tax=Hymenobacter psychrophilus TaxID=651662 RepID=A0A1H3KY43_9BACT|nr:MULTISPECIES: hypothetical protein [Hymenobacter]SDY57083.1 hypothetical protein SAMN04488069_11019 [Hymenobacter psychrophilus]